MSIAYARPPAGLPVVVVGGGLSGLAAAVSLAVQGVRVTVLEQRPRAGGRAYSFTDPRTNESIDNGQHALISGYTRTMNFLGIIGTRALVSEQPRPVLAFHHPTKGFREFRLPALPTPFHLLDAILATDLLSVPDRLRLLRAGIAIRRFTPAREKSESKSTVAQWLASLKQSDELLRSFWEPLAVSIMNEHLQNASALLFLRALQKAFLQRWQDAALAIPTVGLSKLFADPAITCIESHGGTVRLSADVVGIECVDGKTSGVRLKDGSLVEAAAIVLAVPHRKATTLLPRGAVPPEMIRALRAIPDSPIVSVHLWFDHDFMDHDALALVGRRTQWIFNKRRIAGMGKYPGGHISAVISAAHDYTAMENHSLTDLVREDLSGVYGSIGAAPWHSVVIKEKHATFSATPSAESARLPHATAIPNLFLAGDWTATGLPATIEGAVVSGEQCAALAVAFLSQNADIC